MDNKTLLKMIFNGDESLLLKESQNKIEEADYYTLQRAQMAKAKRDASLQAQNAAQNINKTPTTTQVVPPAAGSIINIEGVEFEAEDFKIQNGDENFFLQLTSAEEQEAAKNSSENFGDGEYRSCRI